MLTDRAEDGQTAVFVSDGISDLFGGDALPQLIASAAPGGPRALCDAVMARAEALSDGAIRDDMTIAAVKVFKRV